VDGVVASRGRICFQRDIFGGKLKGLYASNAATTIITVQPGVFRFAAASDSSPGTVDCKRLECQPVRTRYLGMKQTAAETSDITTAPILVAVGNGIGDRSNMALIHHLAEMLPKAAVAGTRIVCDRGWLGYDRQVGITGSSVSPTLYIACGISGASQHVMGMRGAKFVVAINTDPRAPIFNEADICIVEDIIHFIPLIEKAVRGLAPAPGRD
jgi:electron transfer flavoprotein alpha subunit